MDPRREATLELKDSRSTLVEEPDKPPVRSNTPHPLTNGAPATPGSPFSASFNPNAPTPRTPPEGVMFSPMTLALANPPPDNSLAPPASAEAWRGSVTSSLTALAAQFAVASQALSAMPNPERESPAFTAALDVVEQAQARLKDELDVLREQVEFLRVREKGSAEKGREREQVDVPVDAYEERLHAVEKKVEDIAESIRLEYVADLS
ncbi:uncharacterized protein PHACADRAFT_260438 [Phanerochaete carnosa HHB-10118-sp]|uniref:Uncharacterized protein n=1 Tax=Phanerochaete carnosa (strain HHB-10118-sp) TaxID=650164 RepID=K5VZF1_PHACS|nr:uncharacterized protein PHACADRAFT_260438 [Phanerochaete carnosa HHB-10118-sp]EKM52215.1 hypothetical protein PHACADRAFT_260438 [Phanerochaete carnosa HHB-10118-sp]